MVLGRRFGDELQKSPFHVRLRHPKPNSANVFRAVFEISSSNVRDLLEWAATQLENTRLGLLVTSEAPFEAAFKYIQEWREANRTKFTEGI